MYKKRLMIFSLILGLFLVIIIARLVQLQLINGSDYRLLAEKTLQSTQLLPSGRGMIIDRKGRIIAADKPCFDLCLDYRFLTNNPKWVARQVRMIRNVRGITTQQAKIIYDELASNTWDIAQLHARERNLDMGAVQAKIFRRIQAYRKRVGKEVREEREMHPIVPGLSEVEKNILAMQLSKTIGMTLRPGHVRFYPYEIDLSGGEKATSACHIIGLTGSITAEKQEAKNQKLDKLELSKLTRQRLEYKAWDKIGISGVEKLAEETLRGMRGFRRLKLGKEVLEDCHAQAGADVQLTIDIELQSALTREMLAAGYTGSAVILDVETREVLAMVSVPIYDLNTYRRDYEYLANNKIYLPLLNRAVSYRVASGSTLKPVIALAAMAEGVLSPETTVYCRGYLNTPGRFRCMGVHGEVGLVEAIQRSCNVFFYSIAEQVTLAKLVMRLEMLGMGEKPGTGLPEEKQGLLPTEDRVRKIEGRNPTRGDARLLGIGQGMFAVTPLHMANAIATVAARGRFLSPVLIKNKPIRTDIPAQQRRNQPIPPEHIEPIIEGMWKVVNEPRGTAYKYFHNRYGVTLDFDVCAKSGTADVPGQKIDSNNDGRLDTVVREGNMCWLAGFAPRKKPKIAFVVLAEYVPGGHGGSTCGPIAANMMVHLQRMGYMKDND